MQFEKGLVFHIYNKGNNSEEIFFGADNYHFFLKKMREYVCPYADFLCYCLMPNHFHWLVYVKHTVLEVSPEGTLLPILHKNEDLLSISTPEKKHKLRTLNESIGICLRSYTRAINKVQKRSGSLFREETKAKSGWIDEFITVDRYRKGSSDFRAFPDDEYGWNCFNYIHDNPKKANLVTKSVDWPYSSAKDFAGLRDGNLCNQDLAKKLLFLP
jgi:putative transposase